MKIAILGSGGREHAMAWKLAQHTPVEDIYVVPGNGGIPNSIPCDITNFTEIQAFCKTHKIELLVVGPEAPLAQGIVEYFRDSDIMVFGPSQGAARLESSKIWAKEFMLKYGVATADFWPIQNFDEAQRRIDALHGKLVLKYDGLAAGKGVFVCNSTTEALQAVNDLMNKYGQQARYVIEEKLSGAEISIIGFTDGRHIQLLLPSQDHKQLYDGDQGPNTGGMGAYCPVPFCDEAMLQDIMSSVVEPTMRGMQAEKLDYRGVIYFGLMMTEKGAKLLEYNVRLGDPETEVILPALKSDLRQLVLACFNGSLPEFSLEFNPGYFVDVVLVSGGYPQHYIKGYQIRGLDRLQPETLLFHAGTALQEGQLVTAGGRVLNIVAQAETLPAAIDRVYQECRQVEFEQMYYRTDIGKRKYD